MGILVEGSTHVKSKMLFKLKKSKLTKNEGDSAIRFDTVKSKTVKTISPEKIKKRQPPILIVDCEIIDNRRNGIDFWNVPAVYHIKQCMIKENKFSGIFIDHTLSKDKNYNICGCCD
jgi:hypothetical protein